MNNYIKLSKLCEYENCKNIAYYANYYGKANRCKEHRENRQLQYCMCGKSRPPISIIQQKH
jgi:hypothetical protein